jgi:hypothetical protein
MDCWEKWQRPSCYSSCCSWRTAVESRSREALLGKMPTTLALRSISAIHHAEIVGILGSASSVYPLISPTQRAVDPENPSADSVCGRPLAGAERTRPHERARHGGGGSRPFQSGGAGLDRSSAKKRSKPFATIRSPVSPSASAEARNTTGGPLTSGGRSERRASSGIPSGSIPVAVAPRAAACSP